jgi:hypothetical protein
MSYFVDLSRMSLNELINLKSATEDGLCAVDRSNIELLDEHITFRLVVVEKLERVLTTF